MVKLSTLHAAKGLEYDHVFLVGVEEGTLPHREAAEEGRLEEERRLMYVGITRARQSLTITYCERRKRAGEWLGCEPSRFIGEMGAEIRLPGKPDSCGVAPEQQRQAGGAEGHAGPGLKPPKAGNKKGRANAASFCQQLAYFDWPTM